MEVKLLAYTPGPESIVAAAARGCYSAKPASQLLDKTIPAAHGSCFEHVTFTFSVEGVSRVLTHQLVRHRVGTAFSQQSMRYVDVHKLWDHIVIPKTVQEKLEEWEDYCKECELMNTIPVIDGRCHFPVAYDNYMRALQYLINLMTAQGIPSEDQRYFVPNGVKSNITVTMNARELQHFCGLRRCTRAQWEIRELADRMAEIVQEECPEICDHLDLGPQCVQLGYCPEHKCCGRYVSKKDLFNYAIRGKCAEARSELFRNGITLPEEEVEKIKKALEEPRVPIIITEPPECHHCGKCDEHKWFGKFQKKVKQ